MNLVTITVLRDDTAITVSLAPDSDFAILEALNEEGNRVSLTPDEEIEARNLAINGQDETGR